MEMRSYGYGVMPVILICTLATANFIECRKRVPVNSFDNGAAGDPLVIDDKMVCKVCVLSLNISHIYSSI